MKDRGKAVAVSSSSRSNWFSDYYSSSSSSDFPCRKHPSSSSVGICAYCLKDRLIKLVCSDCGEQRLSSCSCSDISSSHPNSCTVDIGSVGRISFLIENDKEDGSHSHSHSNIKSRSESTLLLKRSSSTSTSVEIKKAGFWKFGKLFRKKKDKEFEFLEKNNEGVDEKSEIWDVENRGVSRCRSVCGFRSGFDESERSFSVSTGRPSDLNKDWLEDSEKKSGITEAAGGTKKKHFIEMDESFSGEEDPGFIDLKLGLSSESKPEFSCLKDGDFSEFSKSFDYLRGEDRSVFSNGSSCRITVNNSEIKKCRKSFKVWKWIVKHHSSSGKKDDEHGSKC